MALWANCASVRSIWARTSGSTALSIRPSTERHDKCAPSRRMFSATKMARTGSSHNAPVACTSSRPTTTPADVHTSVMRCRASASSTMEWCSRAATSMRHASIPLSTELATASTMPQLSRCKGCGSMNRCAAAQMMPTAAPTMSRPSKPLEKYSALVWPNGWSSSAGRCAIVTIAMANSAEARFTNDSIASDNRPTESVIHHAAVFMTMVATAAMTDSFRSVLTCIRPAGFRCVGAVRAGRFLRQQWCRLPGVSGKACQTCWTGWRCVR